MELITLAPFRIFAHLETLGIFTALGILAYAARGTTIPIDFHYWRWFVAGITLMCLWVIGLILSVGPSPWIQRDSIVPVLVLLELSGATTIWIGMIRTFKRSFKMSFDLKRDTRRGVL